MATVSLGDYVYDAGYSRRGRVTAIHFGCPESPEWLAIQERPVTQEGRWVSVLVDGGGSVAVHESHLQRVPEFELQNNWADFYWPSEYPREV